METREYITKGLVKVEKILHYQWVSFYHLAPYHVFVSFEELYRTIKNLVETGDH